MSEKDPNPNQLRKIESVFHEARELEPEARHDFLARQCEGETTVRMEVERLLDAIADDSGFLREPPMGAVVTSVAQSFAADDDDDPLAQPGVDIGRYRLLRPIAQGGMGAVWLAERTDGAFEQRVAIKLIKRGMDTDDILRRFRNERQHLANLEHPYIARLLDGGATSDGRPYLVMEFIDGVPIDQHCAEQALAVSQRLQLFRKVCLAIHEAHKNLIVHRDLKPGNILITTDGEPKLLDFGIAKVIDPGGAAQTSITATGMRMLTPRYASPEQVRGAPITTASDVYSLGVILYELLTGCRPYNVGTESRQELERVVMSEEPTRPSIIVSRVDSQQSASDFIKTRFGVPDISAKRLRRTLSGDLDTIVLTALQKDPQSRYGSAEQLADDLQRYLDGLPIQARRASTATRLVKALRRHRREFTAGIIGSAIALVLAVAIMVYLIIVPSWVQSHVDSARLELLDPSQSNNISITVYQERAGHGLSVGNGGLKSALASYDAALRWYPTRADIRRERDVVRLAADDGADIDAAAFDDRARGLLAMLTADVTSAVEAWSKLDLVREPDPLVEGLLGIYYLANDEPARAYPRLTSAHKALPEAGFLCVSLAEAAARCGDGEVALELLERARTLDKFDDETHGAERVRPLALIASGRLDEAVEFYDRFVNENYNPIALYQYAELLDSLGRERDAVSVLARGTRVCNHWTKVNRRFVERADDWWAGLSDAERRELISSQQYDDPTDLESFAALLFAYRVAHLALDRADPDWTPTSPENDGPTLADLTASIRTIDLMGWIRCRSDDEAGLSEQIRTELAGPRRSVSAETQQEILDEDYRRYNEYQYYFAGH